MPDAPEGRCSARRPVLPSHSRDCHLLTHSARAILLFAKDTPIKVEGAAAGWQCRVHDWLGIPPFEQKNPLGQAVSAEQGGGGGGGGGSPSAATRMGAVWMARRVPSVSAEYMSVTMARRMTAQVAPPVAGVISTCFSTAAPASTGPCSTATGFASIMTAMAPGARSTRTCTHVHVHFFLSI